ncbi:hypothetical protein FACS1894111_01870 [Clostridia bacterium]|nr:hypothetical protein FACS1894111_01870 [Clostridia bacterium]
MLALMVFVLLFAAAWIATEGPGSGIPASTETRKKLAETDEFQHDCIIDEKDWFRDEAKAESGLKSFYDKTGVQPKVLITSYNPDLQTDEQKEAWAKQWYQTNVGNENTFLYVYFSAADPYTAGYTCHVNGKQVEEVMDPEAVQIFRMYWDRNYNDKGLDKDDFIIATFDSTADRIMEKTMTVPVVLGFVVAAVGILGIILIFVLVANKMQEDKIKELHKRR